MLTSHPVTQIFFLTQCAESPQQQKSACERDGGCTVFMLHSFIQAARCVCVCETPASCDCCSFSRTVTSHHMQQLQTLIRNIKKALLASEKDDKHQYENTLQTHTQHTNPAGAPPSPQLMNSSVDLNKI